MRAMTHSQYLRNTNAHTQTNARTHTHARKQTHARTHADLDWSGVVDGAAVRKSLGIRGTRGELLDVDLRPEGRKVEQVFDTLHHRVDDDVVPLIDRWAAG
jgi:hypothetical protein